MSDGQLLIFDGGGTIWYSMDVLCEHYRAGFSFLDLCRESAFPFSLEQCNELNSLQQFNSQRAIARGLLALFHARVDPECVLNRNDPESALAAIVAECMYSIPRFEELSTALGSFLVEAFYKYPAGRFPLCRGIGETLPRLKSLGFRLALSSNRFRPSVMEILDAHGISQQFEQVFGATTREDERLGL